MRETTLPIQYRRDWRGYDFAQIQSGDPMLWIDARGLARWLARREKKRGRPMVYSPDAIRITLTLAAVYRLSLRRAVGLTRRLLHLAGHDLPVPSRSTLSRRRMRDQIVLPRVRRGENLIVVLDSTGLKVMGAGEWRRRYGPEGETRVRDFRKSHLLVDAATGLILVAELTGSRVPDHTMVDTMLDHVRPPPVALAADGAYDRASVWALAESGLDVRVPPRVDAGYWPLSQPGARERNEAMIACYTPEGRAAWKQETGYHVRSLAETVMSRSKMLLGDRLTARSDPGREYEHTLRARILNQVTRLGRLTPPT